MIPQITKRLHKLDIDTLAFETGFCHRKPRKITPVNFILSFFLSFSTSKFSLRKWSYHLSSLIGETVSFQAIDKKLQYNKVDFVKQLFAKACTLRMTRFKRLKESKLSKFKRILIQDSTVFKLPNSQYGNFSGVSNGKVVRALARLQICFDICTSSIVQSELCTYSQNDSYYAPKILDVIKPGDLIIRDLGYFSIPVFRAISKLGAFYISKHKKNICITDNQGDTIDLVKHLKSLDRSKIESFDMEVKMGMKEKLDVRICGQRCDQEQAMKNRKHMKSARHKDGKISAKSIYLSNWIIYITNITDELEVQDLYQAYKLRWCIETTFKLWKGNLQLNELAYTCKTPNPARPTMLIYMMLLYTVLVFKPNYLRIAKKLKSKYEQNLSPTKFLNFMQSQLTVNLTLKSKLVLDLILKNCCYDKRSDRTNFYQLFEKLLFLS